MDKLYELLKEIKKRPGLYLGRASLERLYAFINGYKHQDSYSAVQTDCLDGFQKYVEKTYNIHTDHNWASIIQFFSITEEEAFDKFYELLDEFTSSKNK